MDTSDRRMEWFEEIHMKPEVAANHVTCDSVCVWLANGVSQN
jgi:hypothetical protein